MGLFQNKQPSKRQSKTAGEPDGALHFFDDYFREELRTRGREYFEKVIDENAAVFKEDLNATIVQVHTELKEHITTQLGTTIDQINADVSKQLESQSLQYGKAMKDAQDAALASLNESAQSVQQKHQQLSDALQKNVAHHEEVLTKVLAQDTARVEATETAQDAAIQSLNQSVQALQDQYQQLGVTLQKNVVAQEAILTSAFEQNMAKIIEHYLLGALGDQYDMKAQLPSIIKQMEANKQAIVEDMKL